MKWAHLLCAMWIPEVSLGNATFQEPVQDVEKVPKTRWKLVRIDMPHRTNSSLTTRQSCYICKQKMGACIQCGHKSCFEAFHVTCARRARLCLRMKSSHSSNPQDTTAIVILHQIGSASMMLRVQSQMPKLSIATLCVMFDGQIAKPMPSPSAPHTQCLLSKGRKTIPPDPTSGSAGNLPSPGDFRQEHPLFPKLSTTTLRTR